jgi:hypothetical protein
MYNALQRILFLLSYKLPICLSISFSLGSHLTSSRGNNRGTSLPHDPLYVKKRSISWQFAYAWLNL